MHRLSRPDQDHEAAKRLDTDTLVGLALAALGQPAAALADTLGTSVERAIECECRPELTSFEERVRLLDALERRSRTTSDPALHQLVDALRRALWPNARPAPRQEDAPGAFSQTQRESA